MDLDALFTRKDKLALGYTDRDLTAMVRSGQITRLARGMYRPGSASLPDVAATARALRCVVSHSSAVAWFGGSLLEPPSRLELTASRNRGRRAQEIRGVTLHRSDLDESEIVILREAPVTVPLRTALDISRSLSVEPAVASIDSLCRLGRLREEDLVRLARRLPNGPGRRPALLVASLIDRRSESVFESISRVRLALAGFPAPTPQLNIEDRSGAWIGRVDFAWPEFRVVLECDGYEFHCDRAAFQKDRRRWTTLTRVGWKVAVVTWRDVVDEPEYLTDMMRDFLPTV